MRVFRRTPIDLADQKIPRGRVYPVPERRKGCKLCVVLSPRQILQESTEINAKGYHFAEIVQRRGG